MENSGNIRYKFDKKGGGYVVVIASAINGGVDIPPLYNDGKNGEHPVVEIGNEAFALSDAEYVRIPESVVKISTDALYAYVALENIFVDENNPVYKSIDGNLYSKDGKKIIRYAKAKKDTSFDIPNGVVEIGDFAFFGSKNLVSVTIPESVTKIGEWAFALGGLKIANIPNKVKTIGDYAFEFCKNLEQVYIPAGVTHIGENVFECCRNLRSIYVDKQNPVYQSKKCSPESSDTYLCAKDGTIIFDPSEADCSDEECEVEKPMKTDARAFADPPKGFVFEYDAGTDGYAFIVGASSFVEKQGVEIPPVYDDGIHGERPVTEIRRKGQILNSSVYINIPKSVKKIGFDVYPYCRVNIIFVDDENPNYQSIDGVLYSKDGESLIKYPQGKVDLSFTVPDGVTDICESAFDGCPHLKNVVISDSVRFIGVNAFKWCSLEEAKFPTAYNWVLTSYIGGTPQNVGWLSADCLKNGKIAAKYLCEKYSGYMWTPVSEIPDDPEIKNLEIIKKRGKKI